MQNIGREVLLYLSRWDDDISSTQVSGVASVCRVPLFNQHCCLFQFGSLGVSFSASADVSLSTCVVSPLTQRFFERPGQGRLEHQQARFFRLVQQLLLNCRLCELPIILGRDGLDLCRAPVLLPHRLPVRSGAAHLDHRWHQVSHRAAHHFSLQLRRVCAHTRPLAPRPRNAKIRTECRQYPPLSRTDSAQIARVQAAGLGQFRPRDWQVSSSALHVSMCACSVSMSVSVSVSLCACQ